MDTSIFKAFPRAIISGKWELGEIKHGTVVGDEFKKIADVDVIVDEGANSDNDQTPELITSDLLVYARPEQLPTLNVNKLIASYGLRDKETGTTYLIDDAGIGKNQETGAIEHVELKGVEIATVE